MPRKKYYSVVAGRTPGIYDDWFGPEGAQAQVTGFPQAVYKSFQSLSEAQEWYTRLADTSVPSTPAGGASAALPLFAQAEAQPEQDDYYALHQQALASGTVVLYTDGGCDGNPGIGSYGIVMLYKTHRKEVAGSFALTTSNRMELMACIVGLQQLKQACTVLLLSDSAYVVNAITKGWAARWQSNNWQRTQGEELVAVKNADLWSQLLALCETHTVTCHKVRGHAGSTENERCHQLATAAIQASTMMRDAIYEAVFAETMS